MNSIEIVDFLFIFVFVLFAFVPVTTTFGHQPSYPYLFSIICSEKYNLRSNILVTW